MVRKKIEQLPWEEHVLELARELRVKLHDIDQKLEHLIRSHRHFYSLHYQERELDD